MFRFPWGDFHSLNLGWFLQKFNELRQDWATAEAGIDGALDAEIQKAEDALTDVFAARDAAAASASAANSSALNASQSSLASMDARDQSRAARDAAQQAARNAAGSETAAGNSATAASNSAGAAATSATQAGNSATAAGNSATAAGQSATNAAASETAAGNSAAAAAASETAAGNSARDAENAAASVENSTQQIATNANDIVALKEAINITDDMFEMGNITVGNVGTRSITYSNSTTRIRLKRDIHIYVKAGDIINLTSSLARMYIAIISPLGIVLDKAGWFWNNQVINTDGELLITIRANPEAELTNVYELSQYFKAYSIVQFLSNYYSKQEAYQLPVHTHVKTIAHRGYFVGYPENTMPSFIQVIKNGFKYIETDLRVTSDGIPVLLHDESINRTARNADGTSIEETINISDITYQQALEYNFNNGYTAFTNVKIPTLEEFLKLCKATGIIPYLDVKEETQEKIELFVNTVKKIGLINAVVWGCKTGEQTSIIRNLSPYAELALIVQAITDNTISWANSLKINGGKVYLSSNAYSTAEIEKCMNNDVPLSVWTITTAQEVLNLDPYISGVTANGILAYKYLYNSYIPLLPNV